MSVEPVRITVGGRAPYDVVIGEQLLAELVPMVGTNASRVAVIHPRVMAQSGEAVRLALESSGYQALAIEVPDGEAAKTASVAAFCWSVLGRNGFTRTDAIVGVGGGATTDLAGFVAATWLRGVRVVHLPTTLLGMVDAAVGGKTGINTDEGKNLVGAFHPPAGVLCDLGALHTLPQPDYVAGLAEVVKVGFTHDRSILDLIESNPAEAGTAVGRHTSELIARAVRVKARVVAADLADTGEREFLNYGHTLAHAIERNERYTWRHGDAVAVGMVYAANLARLAGVLAPDTARRHQTLLASLGLPTSYRADAWPQLLATMRVDKKSRGDRLRFVVLEDIGQPTTLDGPDPALLVAAYEEVSG